MKGLVYVYPNRSLGLVMAGAVLLLAGCASAPRKAQDGGAVGQVIREAASENAGPAVKGMTSPPVLNVGPIEVRGHKLKNSKFDYPVVVNPAVNKWIDYFTGKGRKHMDKYLARSRYFVPTISKVLKSHNMPHDLVYLSMIESGFNNSARSRAKAVGPWQFIKQTGQRYGLVVDYWLDERRDTRKSTLAAIAYLKELYQEFGSWELAAAGYNAGENKVRRAIAKYRTNDFWEIAKFRFFRRETRDYVPKIIAAAILAKNAEVFGFEDPFRSIKGGKEVVLADTNDDSVDKEAVDEEMTPKELGEVIAADDTSDDPTDDDAEKVVEEDKGEEAEFADDEDFESNHAIVSQSASGAITPSVYMVNNPNEQILEFELKGPADLFAVSKASGLPYSTIKMLNPELMRWCTPPYMRTYRLKLPHSIKDKFLATYNDESFDRKVVFQRYTVKRGETISHLARRYSVDPNAIRELNQLPMGSIALRSGSEINLPIPTGYKRVIASIYDEKPLPPSRRKRGRRIRRSRVQHIRKAKTTSASQYYRLRPKVARKTDRG